MVSQSLARDAMVYSMTSSRDQTVARQATRSARPKTQPAPGTPLDPNDLTRRLYLVLADQKAQAEKRRRDREEAEERRRDDRQPSRSQQKEARGEGTKTAHAGLRLEPSGAPTAQDRGGPKSLVTEQPAKFTHGPGDHKRSRLAFLGLQRRSSKTDLAPVASKAAAEASASLPYVPREAATQFARTTTAANMREGKLSYRLSRQAPKGAAAEDRPVLALNSSVAPLARHRSLRKAQSQLERFHDRCQFEHPRILEEAGEGEEERVGVVYRHTLREGCGGKALDQQYGARRSSTGNLAERYEHDKRPRQSAAMLDPVGVDGVKGEGDEEMVDLTTANEHRVDWTQSDETKQLSRVPLKPKTSAWTLRGKLGSFSKLGREDRVVAHDNGGDPISHMSPKSPKAGFFSRFKH